MSDAPALPAGFDRRGSGRGAAPRRTRREWLAGLAVTGTAHGVVLAALLIGHAGEAATPALRTPTTITASLVRLGKPRAAALLPRRYKTPEPTVAPTAITHADAPVPQATKRPAPDAVKGPKTTPEDPFERAHRFSQENGDDAAPPGDPNGVSGGTADRTEGDPYIGAVIAAIFDAWRVPDLVRDVRGLKAIVFLRVGADGTIRARDLRESSRNRFFDASVIEALQRLQRLPPPPPKWVGPFGEGVELEFNPNPTP